MPNDTAPLIGACYLDRFVPKLEDGGEEPAFRESRGPKGRTIYLPNDPMKKLQADLLGWLNSLNVAMPFAHGGMSGKSTRTNLAPHIGNRYFYTIDIRSAYQALDVVRVAAVLRRESKHLVSRPLSELVEWLQQWCFLTDGGVITGAASAPYLFNLYTSKSVDDRLAGFRKIPGYFQFLQDTGITYTRYLDDLTFSSTEPIGKAKRRVIREVVWAAGFDLADHKTIVNLDISKGPIEIAGVMLDKTGRMFPSKRRRRRANGMLAAALSGDISPAVAHGYVGDCIGALPGSRAQRLVRAEIADLREAQLRLIRERPPNR